MFNSIPASQIARVVPRVVGAGGTGLDLVGLLLVSNIRLPTGAVHEFATAAEVSDYFGASSDEARLASRYFSGFTNRQAVPGAMLMAHYPTSSVQAFMRGGDVSALTLAALQALNGTISLSVDGVVVTSASINLSAASSFSNAASLIQTGMGFDDVSFTGSIATTVLTVSAITLGELAPGQTVTGGTVAAGTKIVSQLSGTAGGVGTYEVDISQTVVSASLKAGKLTVVYDSIAGAFLFTGGTPGAGHTVSVATASALATALKLTAATGAVTSAGADLATPSGFMAQVINLSQNWASFATAFKPSIADMVGFSAWNSAQGNRFAYVMWDNDLTVTTDADTASAGYAIRAADYSGTFMLYDPTEGADKAAFVMGSIASIDFNRPEGRTNMAFRAQAGLSVGVTDTGIASKLETHGYNYYGRWGTANDEFVFLYPGSITGPFLWMDSYINQIWLSNQLQLAAMTLLTSVRSIPYNPVGYALLSKSFQVPVKAAKSFGAIRAGVELSEAQIAQINNEAGIRIDDALRAQGWYLQILPASAQVRAARGSPPCTLWYVDGGSIQRINLNSVEVQ